LNENPEMTAQRGFSNDFSRFFSTLKHPVPLPFFPLFSEEENGPGMDSVRSFFFPSRIHRFDDLLVNFFPGSDLKFSWFFLSPTGKFPF